MNEMHERCFSKLMTLPLTSMQCKLAQHMDINDLTALQLPFQIWQRAHLCYYLLLLTVAFSPFQFLQSNTKTRYFLPSCAALPARRLGCTRGSQGTQPGQLTQYDQRNIPYFMMPHLPIKAEVEKETFRMMASVSLGNLYA